MKYRFELIIMISALLCLLLTAVAPAAPGCVKTLYVDGELIGSSTAPAGLSWPYDRVTIGAEKDRWYLYNEYIGAMDDFAIYDWVMDVCNVSDHWEARTDYAAYETLIDSHSPKLWLKFDDASTVHDANCFNSGAVGIDANYVTVGGDVSALTLVTGFNADSNAVNFPDTGKDANGHCVDVWDGNGDFGEATNGDLTIEVWVNFDDIDKAGEPENDYPRLYQHGDDDDGSYGVVVNDSNELTVLGGGQGDVFALSSDINNGSWHHIVVTYDSTYALPDTNSYDEEVAGDNPFIWLKFEDETATDSSGNGNWAGYGDIDLVKAGGIGTVALQDSNVGGSGRYAAAVAKGAATPSYDGFDQAYALVPNDITIEFWYRSLPDNGQNQAEQYVMLCQQIGRYNNEPNGPAIGTATDYGTGQTQIRIFCGGPSHATDVFYTGKNPYDEEWHHIVVTYDEEYLGDPCSIHMQFYYDGGPLAGGSLGEHTTTHLNIGRWEGLGVELSHMVLGSANDRGYSYSMAPGYYDEFAIYDGILDADSVLRHWAAWQIESCEELWGRGGPEDETLNSADINHDCQVSFVDYALFAQKWALCNKPEKPDSECPPNW